MRSMDYSRKRFNLTPAFSILLPCKLSCGGAPSIVTSSTALLVKHRTKLCQCRLSSPGIKQARFGCLQRLLAEGASPADAIQQALQVRTCGLAKFVLAGAHPLLEAVPERTPPSRSV